jgi:hypothetical protein
LLPKQVNQIHSSPTEIAYTNITSLIQIQHHLYQIPR